MYSLKVTTPPAVEPVTLEEAKDYLSIAPDDRTHDGMMGSMIPAAREMAEFATGRAIMQQGLELQRATFDTPINVPGGEIDGASIVISYLVDALPVVLAADQYYFFAAEPAEIFPVDTWPAHDIRADAIKVEYTAGWAGREDVPDGLKQAILAGVKLLFDPKPFGNFPLGAEKEVMQHLTRNWAVGEEFTIYG